MGDFSLMKDLPGMYHAYEKIAIPQERGVVDFIGDYLMGGKIILSHNKSDAPESGASNIKFQHAVNFFSILNIHFQLTTVTVSDAITIHPFIPVPAHTSEFHKELFRPPLNSLS
jgi:hypothetical protein